MIQYKGRLNADRCGFCGGLGTVSTLFENYDYAFACTVCDEGKSTSPNIPRWSDFYMKKGHRLIPQSWREGDESLKAFTERIERLTKLEVVE